MRLKQIKIINFGQLSNLTFDLPSEKLNLFFGENEAGKSTTVAFIKQVMFGFYLRSSSSPFFEDYKPLAHVSPMGGSLFFEDENGSTFELERLWAKGDKTRRGILTVKKDGQIIPENLFFDQIQNIDGNFYADSFIFNQDMLGQVASLSQADLLERIYYLGAADSSKLLQMRDDFEKDAGRLFKKTGKKPEVNQLLKQIDDQSEQLADSEKQFQDYEEIEHDFNEKNQELVQEQQALQKLQEKAQELSNMQKQLENYKQLQDLRTQVKDVEFNSTNYQKAQNLIAQGKNLQENITNLKTQLEQISDNQNFDYDQARKLVQKRSELLQWQSEYQSCMQKAQQFEIEKQELINLNPDLENCLDLSETEFKQMKNDYNNLPKDDSTVISDENNSATNIWLIVGAVLTIIGIIWMISSLVEGLIGLILGIGLSAYGIMQKKKISQEQKKKQHVQQKISEQYRNFEQKYKFDPRDLDLKNLASQLSRYKLQESSEKANTEQMANLNSKVVQLATLIKNALKKPISANFDEMLNAIDDLDDQIDQVRHSNDKKAGLENNLTTQEQKLKELNLQLKAIFAHDHVEKIDQYDKRYQESLAQTQLRTKIETLENSLKDQLPRLEKVATNQENFVQEQNELANTISQENAKINSLQSEVAQLQVKMNNLADSTVVFEAKQNLANTETQFENASKEYLASLLAGKWISRALDIASNERFPKMLASAREYFELLTGGRYIDLQLDKKITVVRADGKKREVKYLSRGTAEQLYFALKLAFAEQIKDKINLPILIDDSFVNFDDHRIGYIEKLLNKISEHNQVLIFTAQKNLVEKMKIEPLTFEKGSN
ncbi:AAA family ATPase [Lactobacillus hamsteri]|uniref:Dna repair atpase n=1 Tax=Lactobacillus hamsteri DSM 5661 = JCM 6256 TaxID=1423754 RepID=A0A0R1Y6L1_9LACO|nr:AAA family ATPase [Lactobacillus hamsteri]KRM37930.1 dna repair atpase [Lactobacillus hamsteri DSM 5661 = JCM 6256]